MEVSTPSYAAAIPSCMANWAAVSFNRACGSATSNTASPVRTCSSNKVEVLVEVAVDPKVVELLVVDVDRAEE
eukprot:5869537-Amphidinium_carterae.1